LRPPGEENCDQVKCDKLKDCESGRYEDLKEEKMCCPIRMCAPPPSGEVNCDQTMCPKLQDCGSRGYKDSWINYDEDCCPTRVCSAPVENKCDQITCPKLQDCESGLKFDYKENDGDCCQKRYCAPLLKKPNDVCGPDGDEFARMVSGICDKTKGLVCHGEKGELEGVCVAE